MTTELDSNFLSAVLIMQNFKGGQMKAAQAGLLYLALAGSDFTAAELAPAITGGSRHIAGAATGALIAQGLLIVVGREKSPRPNAKGRKLDLLRLAPGKYGTARTWLERNAIPLPTAQTQLGLAI